VDYQIEPASTHQHARKGLTLPDRAGAGSLPPQDH
jgi:hypothetical protein